MEFSKSIIERSRRPVRTARSAAGHSLIEILVFVALVGLVAGVAFPRLWKWTARLRLELVCGEVVTALRQAQFHAFTQSDFVGLKFWTELQPVRWGVYRDGDGDGVLTADIRRGDDPLVFQAQSVAQLGSSVWFGFPTGLRPRDPGDPRRRLDRLHDPIRFGRSDLAVFSHLGTSSPGTLYLTNGYDLAAVRITNRSGRVRILHYDRNTETWQ
jgi:Tfp pilus assembly protein FimT